MRRLVLGGLAAAVVVAAVLLLDARLNVLLLLALAVALAASPRLLRPLDRGARALGARALRSPERLGSLDRRERTLVLGAACCAALMAVSVVGPWLGGSGALALPYGVTYDGWVVLIAGLAGCALVVLAAPSSVGGACALIAGTVGASAAFEVRDAAGDACPWNGGGGNVLGIFCMQPTIGWGLQLATIGSVGLFAVGAAWLCIAGLRSLQQRRPTAPGH